MSVEDVRHEELPLVRGVATPEAKPIVEIGREGEQTFTVRRMHPRAVNQSDLPRASQKVDRDVELRGWQSGAHQGRVCETGELLTLCGRQLADEVGDVDSLRTPHVR